jgi:hypothetical protein
MRLNQLIQFVPITPTENTDDDYKNFYLIPDKTLPEFKYGKREKFSLSIPKNYPSTRATKTWNETQRKKAMAGLTKNFYQRIKILFQNNITPSHRETLRKKFLIELSSLRPHPTLLILKYKAQGELEPNIQLLLKNYEILPDVKISENQFKFLVNAIDENIDEQIILKGFEI